MDSDDDGADYSAGHPGVAAIIRASFPRASGDSGASFAHMCIAAQGGAGVFGQSAIALSHRRQASFPSQSLGPAQATARIIRSVGSTTEATEG
jgi:hypothetical protein